MEVDDALASELARLGPHREAAAREVEVTGPCCTELVRAQAGARGEDDERAVSAAGSACGGDEPIEVVGGKWLAHVVVDFGALDVLEHRDAVVVPKDAVLGEVAREALERHRR